MYYMYIQQSPCRTLIQINIQLLDKLYICRDHRAHCGLGLDESEFTKSVIVCIFFVGHIASVHVQRSTQVRLCT